MEPLYSMKEAAEILGVSRACLSRWKDGRTPPPVGLPTPVKVGSQFVWIKKDLDAWLATIPLRPQFQAGRSARAQVVA